MLSSNISQKEQHLEKTPEKPFYVFGKRGGCRREKMDLEWKDLSEERKDGKDNPTKLLMRARRPWPPIRTKILIYSTLERE
ncbi:hypothetical protein H0H92_009605 [Tricholoma furcatifolium]|nr:hypothetical protein H0H92_009605 [Tricholoma furcatifolium]